MAGNGLEREKAVSIVLGNGLEFMVTFLAVARAGAIAAPLNSAYTVDEFKFFMEDADAQLVIVSEDSDAAIQAAGDLEIPVATISGNRIGQLTLSKNGTVLSQNIDVAPPTPEDIALSYTLQEPRVDLRAFL